MTIKKNILIILVFIFTVLALFINKLTSPRVLSENELLINGLFLFETPKQISDFTFLSEDNIEFKKDDLICSCAMNNINKHCFHKECLKFWINDLKRNGKKIFCPYCTNDLPNRLKYVKIQ